MTRTWTSYDSVVRLAVALIGVYYLHCGFAEFPTNLCFATLLIAPILRTPKLLFWYSPDRICYDSAILHFSALS